MRRRTHDPGEGNTVKALRACEVLSPKAPEPDFGGLKLIFMLLIVGVVACAGICAVTVIHEARRGHRQANAKITCTCMGRCLRRGE